jgi:hypothetical protein
MNTERARLLSLAFLLLACAASSARADVQDGQMNQVIVPVQSGAFVSFTTETVPASSQELSLSFIEAETKPNLIHRVFVDEKREFFFGYDLLVERVAETNQYRISVRPLSAEYEQHLRARKAFQNRRLHPNINRAAFSSRPQLIGDGDTFALDVLVNPRTGVKIVDIIKVTSDDPRLQEAPASRRAPRDFGLADVQLKVTNYKLLLNGETLHRTTSGCAGPLIWFSLPERGRFIFSLIPHAGYDFQKVGTVEHNKIRFTWEGEQYEWISMLPVVGNGGNWNLWVLHDPRYNSGLFPDDPFRRVERATDPRDADLTRKMESIRNQTRNQTAFGANSGSADESGGARKRIRVVIGAAEGIEHLLPKQ